MPRPTEAKLHLIDKYKELVWALNHQGYNNEEIGTIMNRSRSVILRVISEKPEKWVPKWVKAQ
jgi:hypothetical protein